MGDSSDESHLKRKMDHLSISGNTGGPSTSDALVGPKPKRRCSSSDHSGLDPSLFVATEQDLEPYICSACKMVVKSAVSSDVCGHTYCSEYINIRIREGENSFYCPHSECFDSEVIIPVGAVKRNKAMDVNIKRLLHYCLNRDRGCEVTPKFSKLDEHVNNECEYTKVPCSKCQTKILRKEKAEHEATCTSEACPFRTLGCEEISQLGADGVSRLGQTPNHDGLHMALIIQSIRKEAEKRLIQPKDIKERLDQAEHRTDTINSVADLMLDQSKVHQLNSATLEVKAELETLFYSCREKTNQITEIMHHQLPQLAEKKNRLMRRMERLAYEDSTKTKQQETLTTRMEELPLTMEVKEVIYKVSSFSKKRTESIQEENKRFYGPKFYADHHSYLLCPIVYPNGDGSGHERYVSVFIAVCKGPYDDLLEWPMNARISFTVLPQDGRSTEPIRHTFRTDPNSASYRRPEDPLNPASGIPKTLLLTHLKQPSYFLKDDCLFIKISIDLLNKNYSNLSKYSHMLIPKAVSQKQFYKTIYDWLYQVSPQVSDVEGDSSTQCSLVVFKK